MAKEPRKADYQRGYSAGYFTGASRRWPEHKPITPPDPIIGELVTALQSLRDAVDTEIACWGDDPVGEALGKHVDKADAALEKLGQWIRQKSEA